MAPFNAIFNILTKLFQLESIFYQIQAAYTTWQNPLPFFSQQLLTTLPCFICQFFDSKVDK